MFVGSSSALNIAVAARVALRLRKEREEKGGGRRNQRLKVVTVICEYGNRHLSRFWNPEYITERYSLKWPSAEEEIQLPALI